MAIKRIGNETRDARERSSSRCDDGRVRKRGLSSRVQLTRRAKLESGPDRAGPSKIRTSKRASLRTALSQLHPDGAINNFKQ